MRSGLAPALYARTEGDADRVTPRAMSEVIDQDPHVREVFIDAGKAIGIGAANVVTALHPDCVVLGGGVAEVGELLTSTVREVIQVRVGMFPTEEVRVERSLLGERAGLLGAVALGISAIES